MKLLRWVIGIIIVGLILFVLYRVVSGRVSAAAPPPTLDITRLVPSTWNVMGGSDYFIQCDFDGDAVNDPESLVLYRYDRTELNQSGFIGGVVFTSSVNRVPQSPGTQSPYRPALLVPYKLLPDIYSDKGQGYLGESNVAVRLWPSATPGTNCKTQEINVIGYGASATYPDRVSVFRWDGANRRYSGASFAGDARVLTTGTSTDANYIKQVTTYNHFNDRSGLCKAQQYERRDPGNVGATVSFTETVSAFTIDFCYGAPPDAAYPEGVVMTVLRSPTTQPAANSSPTGSSFFTKEAQDALKELPQGLQLLGSSTRNPIRVITVSNPGTLGNSPEEGAPVPADGGQSPGVWWWAPERVPIRTSVVLENGQQYDVTWLLASVANEQVAADTRWRIVGISSP